MIMAGGVVGFSCKGECIPFHVGAESFGKESPSKMKRVLKEIVEYS